MAFDNSDDVIDSRDVIRRLAELRDERDDAKTALEEWDEEKGEELKELGANDTLSEEDEDRLATLADEREKLVEAIDDWENENGDELRSLEAFNEEGENATSEWSDGATLIRESHWKDYVVQLVDDLGDMPKNLPSYLVIDWDATADNLDSDYTDVDFDGVTYKVRS